MGKALRRILFTILIVAILSNAYIHIGEIKETRLNTAQAQSNSTVIKFSNDIVAKILNTHLTMITNLYNRILKLEKRKLIIINKIERQIPDFEKLVHGTVVIHNRGYVVGGVCINEDEDYYYILTCQHILRNRENGTSDNKNVIPESSMGLAVNLQSIKLFLSDTSINEKVPQKEVINITVQNSNHVSVAGEFLYANKMLDLGFLKVYKASGIKLEVIKVAETYPKLGDEVYLLGHPLGRQFNLSRGIVSNLDRTFFMGIDALLTFGDSGGGVFNTNGELIGICSRVPVYSIIIPEPKKDKDRTELIEAI